MKTNRAKHVLSLLLALCMLIVLAPPPEAAAEELSGQCGGDVTWSLSSDGTLTISGTGDLTSGKSGDYYFSWPWNKQREQVKAIVVKEGITSIGANAFYECVNAARISLPNSLQTIKEGGFRDCESLEEVTLPQGVTEIGPAGFCGCYNLQRVFIPASVKKIGSTAFDYTILQDVYYGGTKDQWSKVSLHSTDRWHKRVEMHYSASALPAPAEPKPVQSTEWHFLVAIFKNTSATATADGKTYTVKNSLTSGEVQRAYKVVEIFKKMLADTGLVAPQIDIVVVDTPITKLENSEYGLFPSSDNVFTLLENKKVDLSQYDYVTAYGTITREVRHNYSGITHMVPFADNPGWSFVEGNDHGEAYKDRYLEDQTKMRETAGTMLHELLHTMEYISGYAFNLHDVENEFYAYGIEGVGPALDIQLVKNQVKSSHGSGVPADVWTLTRTKVLEAENLVIPSGVASITGRYYQNLTNLKSVALPSTVTEIGYKAFEGCKNLKTVYIPASVTEIQYSAFNNTGITDVYYGGTEAQWKKITFTRASDGKDYNDQLKKAEIHFSSEMP